MIELVKLLIGISVLILGFFIGNILARLTKEELKEGRRYFIILMWASFAGGIVGLILGNDVLLFTMFFISIVTSRSLVKRKVRKRR